MADAEPGTAAAVPAPRTPRATELRRLLEIVALCGLVVAQPLLDVVGRSPDFFLFHGAGTTEILLLVAFYVVVPPLVCWLPGALTGLAGPRVRRAAHLVTVGLLLVALAVQVGKHLLPIRGLPLLAAALLAGAAVTWAYQRWGGLGQLLRLAAIGPAVFVVLFVFTSPASAVVLGSERTSAGPGTATGDGEHPPVVVLILDELPLLSLLGPDGRIDAERYPHFAELAAGSTWYRNATAVSGWTPYALPAMLSGRYPEREVAPHYSQHPDNLFSALGGTYQIRAQESITELCAPSRCEAEPTTAALPVLFRETAALLGQILSPVESHDDPTASFREPTRRDAGLADAAPAGVDAPTDPRFRFDALDDNQPARFTTFLDGLATPDQGPTLHFLHLLMPHAPWSYLPSGVRYEAPEDFPNEGAGWVELARQRHLAQLGYTDGLIGQTLAALRSSGRYDDALLVVTADHGVSFTLGEQGRGMGAVRAAPAEVLWVPTFVKEPGQQTGRVDDRNWEHVDLLPTIAAHAGIDLPFEVDGRCGSCPPRERADKQFRDVPGEPVTVPGPATFTALTTGQAGPPLPAPLVPELVGRPVAELSVTDDGVRATVSNADSYTDVDPASGSLPALAYGELPDQVTTGAPLAVAVNGRIATVVPALAPDAEGRRFAALITDESLWRAGDNRVEIFEVVGDGTELLRRTD
ncbi:sulfatase-like protein [Micromonospora sp. Llam0]|uniref:sulfatase-like hydrolase/transferase n=1 Tax=Micromonospora sp. Llam0 TaxID=2485143 RepID=UPI000F485AFF|nr:sulfatase-like hydrolase/transferase [Micromonospora sp. Llam0]ROO59896.1 sulfatase-like protein [Micromonospora sp. Llam0]